MKDFGYDISDYCGVDPLFGTMEDFDRLLSELHAAGLRLVLDLVPNHTSDRHSWFIDSRSSRNSPKRDWYIWREAKPDGSPPNNWLSEFGGSAWTFDPASGEYYYHAFLDAQPDLNWRNPAVRAAMFDVMRFWLRKGVDGFRVDVMWHLMKDAQFRDNPVNPAYDDSRPPHERLLTVYSADIDDVQAVVKEMRRVVDEFDDRLLIGEIYLPFERLVSYYGSALDGAHLPFNFALLRAPWNADELARIIKNYEAVLPQGAWPNWVLGNHDRPRIASHVGVGQARNAALLLLSLRGTPTLYYADEIGLPQVTIPPDQIRDPFEINVPGKGVGRDGARTPMQWSREINAGFSSHAPWLPLARDWRDDNVAELENSPSSILTLYKQLLAFRERSSAVLHGQYREIVAQDNVLMFVRESDDECLLVALNLSDRPAVIEKAPRQGAIVFSTLGERNGESVVERIMLRANEGLIVRV
jgi:alpha-glucosidase